VAAFGYLPLFQIQGQRHVRQDRHRGAKCPVEKDLPGGVGHMVLTADDMGDPVANVINHVAEQVERFAVGTDYDKVLDVVKTPFDPP
jgi:hypothetical protein